jgi:hypothetical protein
MGAQVSGRQIADKEWRLLQYFDQPWEKSCDYVFARPGVSPVEPGCFQRRGLARRALGKLRRR